MTETVLLVGGGGREHALARAVADDCALYACASVRNPGIRRLADGFESIDETDAEAVAEYATAVGADLAVIGPESALEAGVADALDDAGVYAFGPRAAEARLETDKAYQREFMERNAIPGCPDYAVFDDTEAACQHIDEYDGDLAVKPAGLTGGKGVKVIGDQVTAAEAKAYLRDSDYDRVVLEERLVGEEFTVQAFVANRDVRTTPAVQDHKRAYEGDEGPNTGGMGSYTDTGRSLPFMAEGDYEAAVDVLEAVVDALPDYKGVLYGQFMLTDEGPKVVEFNARFGDPEAMNTLPVLDTPFVDVLAAARDGDALPELDFSGEATVCKYAVPDGYPTDPDAGAAIAVDEESAGDALLYYASVDERDGGLYTTTSRAFAVVGRGDSIAAAEAQAEDALAAAGDRVRIRHDIGTADLVQRRIDHMDELRP
ncbi:MULTISPECIES: phosphoribosylamine--glycine ligase [Halorubrum]|jgi:phosphoribosylamine--glycine ligase|uniref:Phosphoribosylamine--glycine ligase n=1 Tax=Halorubrum ezzemoulense TaxID=337243 RepID=A0A256JHE6_HALEZ|nr:MULTISPECIES: phosphoribosylamine--glycine ligase [Halorubrum]MDB2237299.1 phosphoribosylamine--glycine ligase [Halorubrum ezzemoulense]MDB2246751.1 phosphoribosylamine--glycine ligase [Halorubrum ezzemoulense]MDB2259901.1 phosphoribosylamine--glycine ligase [Halorubrum ezzemoulense]MDB2266865.1 phosphoribosylamine--glycine ligase [Halorubrum ezzemoulense]MDB2270774.1 phosphoribosylamine--glycine ligase [Halorubrum ezzemoulense]